MDKKLLHTADSSLMKINDEQRFEDSAIDNASLLKGMEYLPNYSWDFEDVFSSEVL